METINLYIHEDDLERIDKLIRDGRVRNRSAFIRRMIDAPRSVPKKAKKRIAVTVEPEHKEKLAKIARQQFGGNFSDMINYRINRFFQK